ncbi:serine hydrolase domain-containing protein [Variovorax sp. PAMC26660]|uniref:serine hydrolase domain-containing protein n=1 Tax=Variovorax sp. PAMC26660 TaxID=2762322 RepID=UPI00164CEBED|nr:serine hydrolase [Variovorax sp. PAMC26660]QNK66627.1 serine hydrolase [Variovorax sp. PAMC26660]
MGISTEAHRPAHHRRRGRRLTLIVAAAILVVLVGGFALTAAIGMKNPVFLVRFLFTPRSEVEALYDTRTIAASSQPRPIPERLQVLPQTVPWKGKNVDIVSVLQATETNAFLVMCHGTLVNEWYRTPDKKTSRTSSWSVAKSVVSLLIGQLVGEGKLSEDTKLVAVLPEFAAGGKFDDITIRDLLDMKSGIDMTEDYSEYKPFTGVAGMQVTTDLPGYLMKNRALAFAPGVRSEYRSVDAQYLSMIVARVEGEPLAKVLERRLWQPLGAEDDATWNLDHADGLERGFGNLNATPRDFAKLGLLVLAGGKVGDRTLISPAWMARIATPVAEAEPGWMYAAQWWHPPGYDKNGDYTAIGVYGQYVYVNPRHHAVIAKLSDYGAQQDEAELIDVFRAVVDGCE